MKSHLVPLVMCWHLLCFWAMVGVVVLPAGIAFVSAADVQPFEDVPQVMPHDRTAEDRVEAAAYFAAAHTAEQRGAITAAIRLYQRSLRRDPNAHAIVSSLVPLLCDLDRRDEAIRYVLKSDAWGASDVLLLRRLGVYLTEEGRWKEAIPVYQRALRARGAPEPDSADLLLAMEMGRLYQLDEQYKRAAIEFDRVLAVVDRGKDSGLDERFLRILLGDQGMTYGLLGDCYLMAGRPEDAMRLFQRSHDASPNLAVFQFNQARVLIGQGKAREGLATLELALAGSLAGEGTAPYELLSEALRAGGRSQELTARLDKLYAADAKNYPLTFTLAQAHMAAGDAKKAETLLAGLMEVHPSAVVFRSLTRLLCETRDMDRLMGLLGKTAETRGLLDFLGDEAQTIASDAPTLRSLGDAANRLLALPTQPNRYGLASSAAVLMLEGKRYDAASEFFEAAIAARREKEAEMLLVWGVGLLLDRQYDDAAAVLKRCAEAQDKDNDALPRFYLTAAEMYAGRGNEAIEAAQQACAARPDSARFAVRLGWIYEENHQTDAAQRQYLAVMDRFGADYTAGDNRAAVREARMALSGICSAQGQGADAEEWLEQVLDEFPDDADALNDLGYLWTDRTAHRQLALAMIKQAVAAEPDNAAFRDSLGWALFRLERLDEAIVQLEAAAKKLPCGTILEHLGDARYRSGQTRQARDAWAAAADGFGRQNAPAKAEAVRRKITAAENDG